MIQEEKIRNNQVIRVAEEMLTAARTAPKARGVDNLVLSIAIGDDIFRIDCKKDGRNREPVQWNFFFSQKSENIRKAQAIVLLGTRIKLQGLKLCGRCGFPDCTEKDKHPYFPCTFNTGDLGIAIGSAVSVAMDHRVDNRVMYTIGQALLEMKFLGEEVKIAFGIPLSVSTKNAFFDR